MTAAFPAYELYLPGQGEPALRWGIVAPGRIASAFVAAVLEHTAQRVIAVGSRSTERAQQFSARFGIERSYGSYEQLVNDPDVDIVYVASPQSEHRALGILALSAGKHVMIEKPLATSAADARALVDTARAAGVFLMEALWSRYQPRNSLLRALLIERAFGEVRSVYADFGHSIPADPTHRVRRPELGGGALLDLGVYPVQFSSMVIGMPTSITTLGALTDTGVDAYSTSILTGVAGAQTTLTTSMIARTPSRAHIAGSLARVELDGPFHVPGGLTFGVNDLAAEPQRWDDPTGIRMFGGLSWEATAAAKFIGEGRTESPVHTLEETVEILATLDEMRRQLAAAGRAA